MAGLTYDLGLNTADMDDTPDTTPGRTTPYVPAAPGVDPKKARNTLPTQSTAQDHFDRNLGKERDVLDRKFMPGYSGYIPRELVIKTSGGQYVKPELLETSPEKVRPFDHVQCSKVRPDVPANHPPSVSHSRDGIERKYVRKPIECAH